MKPKINSKNWGDHFQTPQHVCEYMASFIPPNPGLILEPTAGKGNLVMALEKHGKVFAPDDFDKMKENKFDWIVMNPPFSPMKQRYKILYRCMEMTDNIIALMPYLAIINGEKRTSDIMNYGLKSITHLPRSTFKNARVQTCILEMKRGWNKETTFKILPKQSSTTLF